MGTRLANLQFALDFPGYSNNPATDRTFAEKQSTSFAEVLWHPPSVSGGSSEQSGPGMQPQCRTLVFGTLENMDASGKNKGEGERAAQCTPEKRGAWRPAAETQVVGAPAQADKEISVG